MSDFLKIKILAKHNGMLYALAIILGCICGYADFMLPISDFISSIFIKIFKCMSLPIIAVAVIASISQQSGNIQLKQIGKHTLLYTVGTTVIASSVACILYLLISPANITSAVSGNPIDAIQNGKYANYVLSIIPSNILSPFLEHNVMGALFIGIVIGIAVRHMPINESRSLNIFFKMIQGLFLIIIGWVVKALPLALFGFISIAIGQLKNGTNLQGLGGYLAVVLLSNVVQGIFVLPIFLWAHKINPLATLKAMLSALSVAFFSKSSVGTLPITMETAENNLKVSREISRFAFPLCTAINMNGCAAFIFTTVIYVMQNNGIESNLFTLLQWIFISTIAAIGNAGVPMGCFFLSMSLLISMDISIDILWLILPFYAIIDMVETSLNVWSDCCVVKVIDKKFRIGEKSSANWGK
ncbi:MAG: dicarboxylate/amino acid:cation symporter [Holosporales bacterium]|nr:dicarboxylate/amino acid:cation symporter [Holosporales bacterium]